MQTHGDPALGRAKADGSRDLDEVASVVLVVLVVRVVALTVLDVLAVDRIAVAA